MRLLKEKDGGIVRRVTLVDDAGERLEVPSRFLDHLVDAGYSPNTVCAYGYDLRYLFIFLDAESMDWRAFDPPTALRLLGFLRRLPSRRPAQRLGLALATEEGRLLAPATVQRILAATSSFYEWAIAAGEYTEDENPMRRRPDPALARVPERHQPFVGAASRQQPVRRTVRVRLPMRLPRPMAEREIEALLTSLSTLRDLAITLLILDGGLRPGELLSLHLDDVSYGRRRVTIRKRDDHPHGMRGKSRRERVVDLHLPRTLEAVSRYVLHERPVDSDSPFIFLVGGNGIRRDQPLSYQALSRGFARRLDRLDLRSPDKTPHALRHTPCHGDMGGRDAGAGASEALGPRFAGIDAGLHPRVGRGGARGVHGGAAGPWMSVLSRAVSDLHGRQHADREVYRRWLLDHVGQSVRYNRLQVFDAFVKAWPSLEDWFAAPLEDRITDVDPYGAALSDTHVVMPYLVYLSMVHGVGLDYELLLSRTFRGPFTTRTFPGGLGVDHGLFGQWQQRLAELGYAAAGVVDLLRWSLGRLLLHRGDPDLRAIGATDLTEFYDAISEFVGRQDAAELRAFYSRTRYRRDGEAKTPRGYLSTALTRVHGAHVVLFDVGQVDLPPPGRRNQVDWASAGTMVPASTPPRIAAVVERYLLLKLEANLDRPQTVRHARDALRRLLAWLAQAHPEIITLADLAREHAEEFLRWLGTLTSANTGQPLALTTRRSQITLIAGFVNDTAAWRWDDVPGRVIFTRADIPKTPTVLPRYLPQHELDALMAAVYELPDDYQRAALIAARWSGARRDEIRRLAVDCLDTYPDGHPRLRIPVGKGHAERIIPLHPDAAEALTPLIAAARQAGARARFDASAARPVQYVFMRRGRLLSKGFLFDCGLKAACTAAGLLDDRGRPTVSAHRFRHTIGTQLAEGGARLQTIMAVLGHRTPQMSLIYASLSDPAVRQQYDDALGKFGDSVRLAGPAAETLAAQRLDPQAVHWLQANFLKTELELGHCLRLPQEGPCECDLVLTCSKFVTTSEYAPRLRSRLAVEDKLIADAQARGWQREVERHACTRRRLEQLLAELGESAEDSPSTASDG